MRYSLFIAVLFLQACTVTVHREGPRDLSVIQGDHGLFPEDHEKLVRDYLSTRLKDPFSAQYQFSEPEEGYLREAPIKGGEPYIWGYVVYVNVNAKNSYGAYIGWREHRYFIKDNLVLGEITSNPWFSEPWYQ